VEARGRQLRGHLRQQTQRALGRLSRELLWRVLSQQPELVYHVEFLLGSGARWAYVKWDVDRGLQSWGAILMAAVQLYRPIAWRLCKEQGAVVVRQSNSLCSSLA
jgi:hypothetical protein